MSSFNSKINGAGLTLVDFYATWCGPCKTMAPMLGELKTKVGDKASILKVDVDQNPEVAHKYQIRSVPTLILFKDGKQVWRQSGVVPVNQMEQVIKSNS